MTMTMLERRREKKRRVKNMLSVDAYASAYVPAFSDDPVVRC
jgi:hypothetical protein